MRSPATRSPREGTPLGRDRRYLLVEASRARDRTRSLVSFSSFFSVASRDRREQRRRVPPPSILCCVLSSIPGLPSQAPRSSRGGGSLGGRSTLTPPPGEAAGLLPSRGGRRDFSAAAIPTSAHRPPRESRARRGPSADDYARAREGMRLPRGIRRACRRSEHRGLDPKRTKDRGEPRVRDVEVPRAADLRREHPSRRAPLGARDEASSRTPAAWTRRGAARGGRREQTDDAPTSSSRADVGRSRRHRQRPSRSVCLGRVPLGPRSIGGSPGRLGTI